MRIKNLKPYYLKNMVVLKDPKEGGRRESFSPSYVQIDAYIYDDTHTVQTVYAGIQSVTEKIMLLNVPDAVCRRDPATASEAYYFTVSGKIVHMAAGDGICVHVDPESDPDYRIKGITHEGHLVCGLEKI